jgi:hypothetical protein
MSPASLAVQQSALCHPGLGTGRGLLIMNVNGGNDSARPQVGRAQARGNSQHAVSRRCTVIDFAYRSAQTCRRRPISCVFLFRKGGVRLAATSLPGRYRPNPLKEQRNHTAADPELSRKGMTKVEMASNGSNLDGFWP